jgi:hypothetical protein
MPLTNILTSGAYLQTALLEIVDATSHLEKGGEKDASYIASLFCPHIDEYKKITHIRLIIAHSTEPLMSRRLDAYYKPIIQELFSLMERNMLCLSFFKMFLSYLYFVH